MDILDASDSEAFSIFCHCEFCERPFYGIFTFYLCGIIYIPIGVLMANNTIFDDVFRTMVEKMTYLLVPLINEVFHTSYPEDVELLLPDGQVCEYRVPTVKVERYTKDSIFEKNLLMLLPFYVMRYEESAGTLDKDPEKLQKLLKEYENIRINLEKELSTAGRSELYTDLNKLIVRISDYIFRNEKNVRKGVDEVMGGKVLQLESERLREEGMAIGEARGEARGKAEGEARIRALINHLISDGRVDEIQRIVNSEDACRELYRKYGL